MRVISLSSLSLSGSISVAEAKIPLWWSDGTTASSTSSLYLADGTGFISSPTSASTLFSLTNTFSRSSKFAFEVSAYVSNSAGAAAFILFDASNGNAGVSGTTVSTSSTTETVIRSGQFTLIPGHSYGVALYSSPSPYTVYLSDASLIIFP